jgi:(S)-3,5-dihydroxyphenylglycine transaminase
MNEMRQADLHAGLLDPVLDTMNFLNEITHRYPEAISFAPGRPHDGFFETEQIFSYLRRYLDYLERNGDSPASAKSALFQYGATSGLIRELIADSLRKDDGIDVPPESIVVTVGAQEAMLITLRALISGPDDALLVSSPCYIGITGAARLLDIVPVAVQEAESGFRCADLEAAVRAERRRGRRPRAFYVTPDHSNPSGNTMPLETRKKLLDLAAREDILILEDSPYRMVSPGKQLPTLKYLDRDRRVVYIGSFAKTLFPGARVGFAVADQPVVNDAGSTGLLAGELSKIKSMVTVNTSPLSQAVVAGMLLTADGRTAKASAAAAAYYGTAMRTVLRCLEECFQEDERAALGIRWNQPSGGFFLTLRVPFHADNAALARSAEEFGVIWTPMSYFYPSGGGERSIRLSVSYVSPTEIPDGVTRLARFVRAEVSA